MSSLTAILLPKTCVGCKSHLLQGEHHLCLSCRHQLPFTYYEEQEDNPVKKIFCGRVPIHAATALLHFTKQGIVQEIIHAIKYRDHTSLAEELGHWLGHQVQDQSLFSDIDLILPVPLHPLRRMRRGYNQVDPFGGALAQYLNASFSKCYLKRKRLTSKLAFKGRLDRWTSLENAFTVRKSSQLEGKHVLLVDDVITTGATLEACALQLLKVPNIRISIAAMAITD